MSDVRDSSKKKDRQAGMGSLPHEAGTTFRVWVPFADAVHVIGSFNEWDEQAHPLTAEGEGYGAFDVSGVEVGDESRFLIREERAGRALSPARPTAR